MILTGLFCVDAGKPAGGTFLAHCYPGDSSGTGGRGGPGGHGPKINGWGSYFQNDSHGYIEYGAGNYDGQGSGSNFNGTVWHPTHGGVNNCDGARSHWACDYNQQ